MYAKIMEEYKRYMEADVTTIKLNIRRILKERYLKQAYLTQVIDIKPTTVVTLTSKSNKSRPEFMSIVGIAHHFGVGIDYFLTPLEGEDNDEE